MKRLLLGSLFLPLLGSISVYPGRTGGGFSGGTVASATTFSSTVTVNGIPVHDPFGSLWIFEEFVNGGTSDGAIGSNGLLFNAIATGTVSRSGTVSPTGAFILLSHATNDNSGINLQLGSNSQWDPIGSQTVFTNTDWEFDVVFFPGTSSTAITNIQIFVGLMAPNTADPVKAGTGLVGVRYDTDLSDATYIFVTCDSATTGCASAGDDTNQKVVASTKAPSAGAANRFRVRRAASGVGGNPTIYMRVNDETEKTFCSSGCDDVATEIPAGTVPLTPAVSYLTRTTSGVMQGEIDYMSLKVKNLPARYTP